MNDYAARREGLLNYLLANFRDGLRNTCLWRRWPDGTEDFTIQDPTMFNSIISDTSAAIKLIAALYEAGVIDTRTYHSVLTKYAPAS